MYNIMLAKWQTGRRQPEYKVPDSDDFFQKIIWRAVPQKGYYCRWTEKKSVNCTLQVCQTTPCVFVFTASCVSNLSCSTHMCRTINHVSHLVSCLVSCGFRSIDISTTMVIGLAWTPTPNHSSAYTWVTCHQHHFLWLSMKCRIHYQAFL
jgi:hypothetical protein